MVRDVEEANRDQIERHASFLSVERVRDKITPSSETGNVNLHNQASSGAHAETLMTWVLANIKTVDRHTAIGGLTKHRRNSAIGPPIIPGEVSFESPLG